MKRDEGMGWDGMGYDRIARRSFTFMYPSTGKKQREAKRNNALIEQATIRTKGREEPEETGKRGTEMKRGHILVFSLVNS